MKINKKITSCDSLDKLDKLILDKLENLKDQIKHDYISKEEFTKQYYQHLASIIEDINDPIEIAFNVYGVDL
jgi:hypothetical protein